MTIAKFQRLLKKIDPRLTVRIKAGRDAAGIFFGVTGRRGYICRLSKGELQLDGMRLYRPDPDNPFRMKKGQILKRGRISTTTLLRNYRWITNHKQRSMLLWGIDYPEEEVRGITYGHTND